jgi:uncharacterized protein YdeI (YjbR/CyaY-like superfamily)
MEPVFFGSGEEFRSWLERNHHTAKELQVGLFKKGARKAGITYDEAVDEALSFGWIDGVTHRIDDARYTIRFTPRTPKSNWSLKNTRRVGELKKLGRMHPSGSKVFEERDRARSGQYSFEHRAAKLPAAHEKRFRSNRKAWAFWEAQPPGYRNVAIWWVISAKKEETRARRLGSLIEHSARGKRVPQLVGPAPRPKR